MKPKTKLVRRFRVMVNGVYCSLSKEFHELGVCLPNATEKTAHVFDKQILATNAMKRTSEAQSEARHSLHRDWAMFKPLMFSEAPEVEEFQLEESV